MKGQPPEATTHDAGSSRPLLARLGVKSGMRVAIVGFEDPGFAAALQREGTRVEGQPRPGLDLLFYFAPEPSSLFALRELQPLIHDAGAIWVLRVKGPDLKIRDTDVIEAARRFGLVDNKIASFSDRLAAMRLVVPLANRGTR